MEQQQKRRKEFTAEEEAIIRQMRGEGVSIGTIACYMRVGKERIKRFCKDNDLPSKVRRQVVVKAVQEAKEVGIPMPEMPNAACRGKGANLFYHAPIPKDIASRRMVAEQNRQAILICSTCEHQVECLEYALIAEPYGVWGGTTDLEREYLRKKFDIVCQREGGVRLGRISQFGYQRAMPMEMLDSKFGESKIVQNYIATHA